MTIARPAIDRLMEKQTENQDGCWMWTGAKVANGYGYFRFEGRTQLAHRVAYELLVEPIPDGLTIDHLCHDPATCVGGVACPHRACVNPAHMEVVTQRENVLRGLATLRPPKTHCPQGHPFDEVNTYIHPRGGRVCRICVRAAGARYRARLAVSA